MLNSLLAQRQRNDSVQEIFFDEGMVSVPPSAPKRPASEERPLHQLASPMA
jgi:hypothetical protein